MELSNPTFPFDTRAVQPLLGAVLAQCTNDGTAFATHFYAMQQMWHKDGLASLAGATAVAALALRQVIEDGSPAMVSVAVDLGFVDAQPVPDHLKGQAIDLVLQFAQGCGPNWVEVLGNDSLVHRQVGAVMAAFTVGIVRLDALRVGRPPEESHHALFARVLTAMSDASAERS